MILIPELSSSKDTMGAELSSVSSLKLEKGKEKAFPVDIDEAKLTLHWTAVDFGIDKTVAAPKPSSSHHHAEKKELPMPAADEIEKRFAEIARNANLNEAQMKTMGLKEKWQLVQNFALANKAEGQAAKPEYWVQKLRAEPNAETIKTLTFHIGSKGVNWLEEFSQLGGIKLLAEVLGNVQKSGQSEGTLKTLLVHALDKLMNNQRGLELVLATPGVLKELSLTWNDSAIDVETRQLVLKLLSFVCLMPGGHGQVLVAMDHFHEVHREKARFETLVKVMSETPETETDMLVSYMTFINSLANAPSELDNRQAIRAELQVRLMPHPLTSHPSSFRST